MNNEFNIEFVKFDQENYEQNEFIQDIINDNQISQFVADVENKIKNEKFSTGLLARDVYTNEYIGICILNKSSFDTIRLEYAINSKNRNKHYGTIMLKQVIKYIFGDNNIEKIILEIKQSNNRSIAIATKNGFTIDYSFNEEFSNEGYDYTPYTLNNPNIR